jgi:HD superfamily phosphohydrolase
MKFELPRADEMSQVVRNAMQSYLEWHICETFGVHKVEDLTYTEIQSVMSEYFNQKSMNLGSMISLVLKDIITKWEEQNGRGIL